MRLRAVILVALFASAPFAGCLAPEDPGNDAERAKVADWTAARDAHGPMGYAATFDLGGPALYVNGPGQASFAGAVDLVPGTLFPADRRFVYFPNATVDGHGTGLVVIEADKVRASAFPALAFQRAHVRGAETRTVPQMSAGVDPAPRFPGAWEDANRSMFFSHRFDAGLAGIALSGATRAVLLTGDLAIPLPTSFTITAAAIRWDPDESAIAAPAVVLQVERASLGGDVRSGEVRPEGRASITTPAGVWGGAARIRLENGRASTLASFRLTQALTTAGYALPATVELYPSTEDVSVKRGESAWVRLRYRESSYTGDAVLGGVAIEGTAKPLIDVPIERPPLVIEQMWQIVNQSGPASPFVAVPIALASPGIILIDFANAILCGIAFCPEQHPYPQWMDAGDVGSFYVKVKGEGAAGTHDATVTLTGKNFPAVSFPLRVTVTD